MRTVSIIEFNILLDTYLKLPFIPEIITVNMFFLQRFIVLLQSIGKIAGGQQAFVSPFTIGTFVKTVVAVSAETHCRANHTLPLGVSPISTLSPSSDQLTRDSALLFHCPMTDTQLIIAATTNNTFVFIFVGY